MWWPERAGERRRASRGPAGAQPLAAQPKAVMLLMTVLLMTVLLTASAGCTSSASSPGSESASADRPVNGTAGPVGADAATAAATVVATDSAAVAAAAVTAARRATIQAALDRRATAVTTGNADAWSAAVDPAATDEAAREAVVWSGLRQVRFDEWSWRVRSLAPLNAAAPEWAVRAAAGDGSAVVVTADLHYRISGADSVDVVRSRQLLVVERAGGQLLRAVGPVGAGAVADPWDLGPVSVARGSHGLVLASGASPAQARAWAARVDDAVARVDDLWGTAWTRRPVVEVPVDLAGLADLLGRSAGDTAGLDAVAAVTTGLPASGQTGASGTRVVINPAAFGSLSPAGGGVVLTHELTHVATRSAGVTGAGSSTAATSGAVPSWLSEGVADYTGYRDSGLPLSTAASELVAAVGARRGPSALPSDAAFDLRTGGSAVAYESAWWAAHLIAGRWGEPALVRLYREVQRTDVDAAFRAVLGVSVVEFTASWRDSLTSLLHLPTPPATSSPRSPAPTPAATPRAAAAS